MTFNISNLMLILVLFCFSAGFFVYMLFSIWNSKEGSLSFQIDEELESQNTSEETEHILEGEEIDKLSFD